MRIYNTMSRKKEEFQPITPNEIHMYVCGPTVYDLLHIGNARPMVVFDTFRRYCLYKGYQVNYVQNFTDVDDKIIQRAAEMGIPPQAVAEKYIAEAQADAQGLRCLPPVSAPRVTQEMDGIIQMIQILLDKGYAYTAGGEVFYSTPRFRGYGKLSGKNPDELTAGARVEINANKRDPMDFVLWKPGRPGDPKWDAPWGAGRPGWHIECSVMAKKYLGDTFDIHAGGEDLIFPHHENEIAQSEAANGCTFARYWMHVRYINIDNQKMSKSLGNFFTLREVAEKFTYGAIRFFLLSAHYRSPINFSDELLQAAQNGLRRIRNCAADLRYAAAGNAAADLRPEEKEYLSGAAAYARNFEECMEDDLNTADALAAIFELVKYANVHLDLNTSKACAGTFLETIQKLCDILGLDIAAEDTSQVTREIEALIADRQEARKSRNWAEADRIRDELRQKGILLEDRKDGGVRWSRLASDEN